MKRFFFCMLLSLGATIAWPAHAQSEKRELVVIYDSSGSMVGNDYSRNRQRRSIALDALKQYLNDELDKGDISRAALITFGSEYSWRETISKEYARAADVPSTNDYCAKDFELALPLTTLTNASPGRFMSIARSLSPNGMTPIVQALRLAASELEPAEGGIIAIISDWEDPNCIPEGETLCEAILNVLGEFDEQGGTVEMRFVSTPPSENIKQILDCKPTDHLPIITSDPEGGIAKIEKLVQQSQVRFQPEFTRKVIGGRSPIVAATDLRIDGPDINGRQKRVYRGAVGLVELFPGSHQYTGEIEGQRISGAIDVTGNMVVPIRLNPAEVTIHARTREGTPLPQRAEITVSQNGTPIDTKNLFGTETIDLAPGRYAISVELSGQEHSKPLNVRLNQVAELVFNFDARPRRKTLRKLDISVATTPPDLFDDLWVRPRIRLSPKTPGSAATNLGRTGTVREELTPGVYVLTVYEDRQTSEWEIVVPAGDTVGRLDLDIKPGWLRIDGKNVQNVEIKHASGEVFAVQGLPFEGSLPAGTYRISFNENSRRVSRAVSIFPGRATQITLP